MNNTILLSFLRRFYLWCSFGERVRMCDLYLASFLQW